MHKTLVLLDIGGVVATIDKSPLNDFLRTHKLNERDFYDQDFLSLQLGNIEPDEFFLKKSPLVDELRAAFRSMIKSSAKQLLKKIKIPYLFLSNINEIHFDELDHQISFSDFARQHSRLSYQVGCLKPHDIFFTSLKGLCAPNTSIVYIDDKPENLKIANKLGIVTAICEKPDALPSVLGNLQII